MQPKISDFSFLAGSWSCQIWDGTFIEVWTTPKANSMTNMGRHFKDDKQTFMEFGSIELNKSDAWEMHVIFGNLGDGPKKPTTFSLQRWEKGSFTFVSEKNDFPTHITYSAVDKNAMKCVISGRADGTKKEHTFNFQK